MKVRMHLIWFCTFIFIIHPLTIIHASSESNDRSSFINSFEEDLTGDGLREYFKLQGTLLSNDSNYYRDVWLNITSPFSKQWKVSFSGGYNPTLKLVDLNHDHTVDLLYEVARDESNRQFQYQLYTLKNNTIQKLPLPKHNYIQGKFMNNFKVSLQIDPKSKPMLIDVSHRKNKYIEHKVYDDDGILLKERKLIINQPSKLQSTLISESKGYGLKSHQMIKGIDDEDLLGNIETLWYFKNENWIVLRSNWTN